MSDVAQITENLYVGGWSAARDMQDKFDVIVNCAVDAPNFGTHQFKLVDGPGNRQSEFDAAVDCVEKALRANRKVLVHCVSGKSRSVTIAALALSRVYGTRFTERLEAIRAARRCEERQPHPAILALTGQ